MTMSRRRPVMLSSAFSFIIIIAALLILSSALLLLSANAFSAPRSLSARGLSRQQKCGGHDYVVQNVAAEEEYYNSADDKSRRQILINAAAAVLAASSSSPSLAEEIAKLKGEQRRAIAIIGDGALTAGMAFEALSHAGDICPDMLVILNDNDKRET